MLSAVSSKSVREPFSSSVEPYRLTGNLAKLAARSQAMIEHSNDLLEDASRLIVRKEH
jgi:hypothetical protein